MKKVGIYQMTECEVSYYILHPRYLSDGRHLGSVGEDWWESLSGGTRQPENSSYDVLEKDSERSEIRSAVNNVSFAASKETGYGRKVTEEGFNAKLDSLDRFLIMDTRKVKENNTVDFWELNKEDVLSLGLGKNKKMKANKFWKIVDGQN
jgi:hypothetical protein